MNPDDAAAVSAGRLDGFSRLENGPFLDLVGPVFARATDGGAAGRFAPGPHHLNQYDLVHGGALMTAASHLMGYAGSAGTSLRLASFSCSFVAGARAEDPLSIEARPVRRTPAVLFTEGVVMAERPVLTASAIWEIAAPESAEETARAPAPGGDDGRDGFALQRDLIDPFERFVGPTYARAAAPGHVDWAFRVLDTHRDGRDECDPGMLLTFADMSTFTARGEIEAVTIAMSADFPAPARPGDWITSDIRLVRRTPDIVFITGDYLAGTRLVLSARTVWKTIRT